MNMLSKLTFAAMDFNGPPGLTHPLLVEKYTWVDQRLNEFYHNYALTADNCDEYEAAGLLTENWAWVDDSLRKKYYSYALTSENCDEYEEAGLLCLAPLAWVDYRERDKHYSLEEDTRELVIGKCSRSESDISDHEEEVTRVFKRLRYQSPLPCLLNHLSTQHLEHMRLRFNHIRGNTISHSSLLPPPSLTNKRSTPTSTGQRAKPTFNALPGVSHWVLVLHV